MEPEAGQRARREHQVAGGRVGVAVLGRVGPALEAGADGVVGDLLRAGAGGGADLDHVLDDARHPGPERARPVALDDVVGALLGDEETDVGGDGSGEGHVGRLRVRIRGPSIVASGAAAS